MEKMPTRPNLLFVDSSMKPMKLRGSRKMMISKAMLDAAWETYLRKEISQRSKYKQLQD